jgi:hypothetical protein
MIFAAPSGAFSFFSSCRSAAALFVGVQFNECSTVHFGTPQRRVDSAEENMPTLIQFLTIE